MVLIGSLIGGPPPHKSPTQVLAAVLITGVLISLFLLLYLGGPVFVDQLEGAGPHNLRGAGSRGHIPCAPFQE